MGKGRGESAGEALQVVLLPFPAQGHINPMLELGKRLAARGLPATLAITRFVARSMPQQPEKTGLVRVIANISDGHDEGGLAVAESVQSYLDGFKAEGSRTLAELIREEDAQGRPVRGVVYDSRLPWALGVAKGMGLLAASFFTQCCAVNAVYHHAYHGRLSVPPSGPAVMIEGMTALRLEETPSFISTPGRYPEYLDAALNQYLNLEKADAVLVNTFHQLEPQEDWPPLLECLESSPSPEGDLQGHRRGPVGKHSDAQVRSPWEELSLWVSVFVPGSWSAYRLI